MAGIRRKIQHALSGLRTQRGRDAGMFLIFLAASALLWCVLTLNEQEQRDIRMNLRITHIPDSVTVIDKQPQTLNANISVSGSQVLRMAFSHTPTVNVDFRAFSSGGRLFVSNSELKALVRNASGTQQVGMVYPDSVSLRFTTDPGVKVPLTVIADVQPGPRSLVAGRPHAAVDSVTVYSLRGGSHISSVHTETLAVTDLDGSLTRRMRIIAPANSRVIPDSVDVTVEAEPLIFKTRKVSVEPVNVPEGMRLITFPAQVTVMYMVAMSAYTHVDPHFRVVADYRRIDRSSAKMVLKLEDVAADLRNVHLENDSAEYIIERL